MCNKTVGPIMRNYKAVIIMPLKVKSNKISFTPRLLKSNHVNECELAFNNGCQQID